MRDAHAAHLTGLDMQAASMNQRAIEEQKTSNHKQSLGYQASLDRQNHEYNLNGIHKQAIHNDKLMDMAHQTACQTELAAAQLQNKQSMAKMYQESKALFADMKKVHYED